MLARRIALVTCRELPDADPDTRLLIGPLARRGMIAVPVVWDDPAVDWNEFDLAIVRSCWDYPTRRADFLSWAARVPRLANPFPVLDWNTDKRYLADLEARSIPVIPTTWLEPGDDWLLPTGDKSRMWVIKPAVSLCALDSGRYDLTDPAERRSAAEHVGRLQAAGRTTMIQPYMAGIDRAGETSLVFIAGRFSHAIRRSAVLQGPDRGADNRFAPQGGMKLTRCDPSAEELALAQRALSSVPGGAGGLLYARVDLVPDARGEPVVMEIELTEPNLYLAAVPEAIERLADGISSFQRARIPREEPPGPHDQSPKDPRPAAHSLVAAQETMP